jgi:hypothetical protein
MDHKEHWQVLRLYSLIGQGTFTEEDVFTLPMILRQRSEKGSPARECSDFIAHGEQDCGNAFRYLQKTKNILENIGNTSTTLEIKPIFTILEPKACLVSCFAQFNLEALGESSSNASWYTSFLCCKPFAF